MINGAHVILYSSDPEADRAFLRDVLGLPHVDVGEGWLIFGLPPSEAAVHPVMPGASPGSHELYFMCEDIQAFAREMASRKIACTDVQDQGWGLLVAITLPSGAEVGVYQPRHERPAGA
jgi:catechol 2,3-dioxygenase-like lactoylglutathione lyase family enzyme